ncbi:hypothetical protein IFR05_013414 [Cadophora sp. M221]|nr:hypothetical protein IFR05_013414 [Cadophora sp. M221]
MSNSTAQCCSFASMLSQRILYAFFTFPYTLWSAQNSGTEDEEHRATCSSRPRAIMANCYDYTTVLGCAGVVKFVAYTGSSYTLD